MILINITLCNKGFVLTKTSTYSLQHYSSFLKLLDITIFRFTDRRLHSLPLIIVIGISLQG